jgi:hypothetical protein
MWVRKVPGHNQPDRIAEVCRSEVDEEQSGGIKPHVSRTFSALHGDIDTLAAAVSNDALSMKL